MDAEIIEAIAVRWFEREGGVWDKQPDSVKAVFRAYARQFWDNPSRLTRALQREREVARNVCARLEREARAWA